MNARTVRNVLVVAVALLVCASGAALALASTGAFADEHNEGDDGTAADEQDGDGDLRLTVENATVVIVGPDHELADRTGGETGVADDGAADNATTSGKNSAIVHETSIEVTIEQASMLQQGEQTDDADSETNETDVEANGDTEGTAIDGENETEGLEADNANETESDAATAGADELTIQEATIVVVLDDGTAENATADGDLAENDTAAQGDESDVGVENASSEGDETAGNELSIESASIFVVVEEFGDASGVASGGTSVAESSGTSGVESGDTSDAESGLDDNESDIEDNETGLDDNETDTEDNGLEDTGTEDDGDRLHVTIERATIVILINDMGDMVGEDAAVSDDENVTAADEGIDDNATAVDDEGVDDGPDTGVDDNATATDDNATAIDGEDAGNETSQEAIGTSCTC